MRIFPLVIALELVQGCNSFENILPDREKEYKYSSEIPPLEIPPDLTSASIEKSPIRSGRAVPGDAGAVSRAPQRSSVREEAPETRRIEPMPTVERSAEGAYINIDEDFPIAWRMVGRSLSRLEIEVEDLNRSEGLYYIIFEDRRNRSSDDGFFSSLAFWSDSNSIEEQQFRVQVDDKSGSTQVRILDEDGIGLSKGTGLDLLQMIQKKINDQIAEK